MPLITAALDEAADAVAGIGAELSLHTSNPGGGGSNEVSGSGYARAEVTWDPASGGVSASDSTPIAFTGPALQSITHVGLWTTGGSSFLGSAVPTGDLAFNADGELSVIALTITATSS